MAWAPRFGSPSGEADDLAASERASARCAGRGRAAALVALAIALIASGVLASLVWWRSDSDACTCEWCPDRYCDYAEAMRAALAAEPAGWERLAAFGGAYVHAHSPLAPALMTPGLLAGLPPVAAFGLVSAAATLLAWLAVRRAIGAERPERLVVGLV